MSREFIKLLKSEKPTEFIKRIREGELPFRCICTPVLYKALLAVKAAEEAGVTPVIAAPSMQAMNSYLEMFEALGQKAVMFPHLDLRGLGLLHSNELHHKRAEALYALRERCIAVTTIEALMIPLEDPVAFHSRAIRLEVGQEASMEALGLRLINAGYQRTPLIEALGQYSIRGGIMDVYCHGGAVRAEFFGDEVESIREMDASTQRSFTSLKEINILPVIEANVPAGETGFGLWDYAENTVMFLDEPERLEESCLRMHTEYMENFLEAGGSGRTRLFEYSDIACHGAKSVYFSALKAGNEPSIDMNVQGSSLYNGRTDELAKDISFYMSKGYKTLICSQSSKRAENLSRQLLDKDIIVPVYKEPLGKGVYIIKSAVKTGFISPEGRLAVIGESDLDIVKRPVKLSSKRAKMEVFADLSPGDYVVHDMYGIGKYIGMDKVLIDDAYHDYMVITYHSGDKLKVPTDQMNRVQKYIGGGEAAPKLSRLGGSDWTRAKKKVSESVKELAFDLAGLYAARQAKKGFAFSKDTPWQRQFEDDFPYKETPDQLLSVDEIKRDMESFKVMDRLLCGDVGYGKTEVAMRAAFKACMDSKQVAMLVPTTILAQQHFATFTDRMKGYPIRIAMLSRFVKSSEAREIILKLKNGELDIVIGTHKLLAKDVGFKDLGLLILDEEQRFGVAHKENIKRIKNSVDVLTLSATPIPRTLHMSLSGIRDMSVIDTPPEQRYPVQTYVAEYSEALALDAISRETSRGGQVFFVYNDVKNIEIFKAKLSSFMPGVSIAVAHGQMSESLLERTMLAYQNGEYDVLLCSTIIESGLDMPNVNTIIVYDADRFGLSQLYQLRGRVGRSTKLAYAYFVFRQDKVISETAQKRLIAIREFIEFGSGFKIAMRDLELRGAGNIMGAQQHGHMSEVGYEMYCRMIEEAVKEIKGDAKDERVDTIVDIGIDAFIPNDYIEEETVRIDVYRRIAGIDGEEDYNAVWEELEDRFSVLPRCVQNLLTVSLMKSYASKCGVGSISVREGKAFVRMSQKAKFDNVKVIGLLSKYKNRITLSGREMSVFTIKNKKDAEDMALHVINFLKELKDCKEGKD